jgi:tetratricopeptide (TPR) repeat protein
MKPLAVIRVSCLLRALPLCLALGCPAAALGQQYRSEVRELPDTPAEQKATPEQLLEQTRDPYQRALLLRELAVKAARDGDNARAAELLNQAIATNALSGPAAQQMRDMLGQVLLSGGRYKQMQGELEAQVRRGGASPEIRVALAAAYLEDQRHRDAIPLLEAAIKAVETPDVTWRRALVSAYLTTNAAAKALPLLEQLVKELPGERDLWSSLAAVQLAVGQKRRAAATLELAERLGFMNSAQDRMRLVGLAAELGAPYDAASLLQRWMETNGVANDAANRRLLAQLLVAARETRLAIPALQRALNDGRDAELLRLLAQLHMQQEQYDAASRQIEQLMAVEGEKADSLMMLASAHYQQAEIDEALQNFRRAASLPGEQAALAREWVRYLESGRARELAMAAAAEREQQQGQTMEAAYTLVSRFGEPLDAADGATSIPTRKVGADSTSPPRRQATDPSPTQPRPTDDQGDLTPIGAQRAGNASGTIPAWTGGITPDQHPSGFVPGEPLPDPFAADQPLYTVTADNLDRYRSQISPAHQHLLENVPGYAMPVFPTRRSVRYPDAINAATRANRDRARLDGPDALKGARLGFPFPVPRNGVEIMWNHRTRYRGDTVDATYDQAVIQRSGSRSSEHRQGFKVNFRYGNIADAVDPEEENYIALGITQLAPAGRSADVVALFHETLDSERQPRNVWVLLTRAARMFRIPPVGYDQPFPGSDGLEYIDMVDMYNGAFDRYVWKLQGKRELLIPYNAYRLNRPERSNDSLLQPLAFDSTHSRYELHRVWVIEASERGGERHSFGKRVFYVDEDSWTVVMVENHDRKGNLWRFQEGHLVAEYDIQAAWARPVITYDLKDGRYFANRLHAESRHFIYNQPMSTSEFLPASVRRTYGR